MSLDPKNVNLIRYMERLYASNLLFHFYSGKSCIADCSDLLYEMGMVGLMSHIAVVNRVALNRKSLSMKIAFTRDKRLPVPCDSDRIPDCFGLSIRCLNPEITSSVYDMHCTPEINSLLIDASKNTLSIIFDDGGLSSINIIFTTITITSHVADDDASIV